MILGISWIAFVILAVLSLAVSTCYYFETSAGGLVSLVLAGAGLQFFGGVNVLSFISTYPQMVPVLIALYIATGFSWAYFVKWPLKLKENVRDLRKSKAVVIEILKVRNIKTGDESLGNLRNIIDDILKIGVTAAISIHTCNDVRTASSHLEHIDKLIEQNSASTYKYKIIAWVTYWPISMILFVVDEPIARLYDYFRGGFQRKADKAYADI